MFTTRVERQIEAAHHNGPDTEDNKCRTNHGHSWKIVVECWVKDEKVEHSAWGWGVDFSLIKKIIDYYDHQDLNVMLSPLAPSAENLARVLWASLVTALGSNSGPNFVEVSEGSGNSVRYSR